ncbi:hypothetical protein METBIDRAFT_116683 [Metschnikowia bicuspidata var. bicuspidata NRRL YB-4993]|uniref:Uncharacterized protein n=1 Tax=Metschnikowia bicuspidata var. bicuspidata NRRL YB-4993 TaxID=869754 RepID=A0A1A0HJ47_9ASCO|nr:hypothetical protein METBIDRAFT_116683 [Metschnikowia bicuspidata var. bicuspidata NRRL YB-4993]OBA24040.1 hypothetical protein METBIDRAFT_116683 [Metschnikowia bicuspidata var. bicuspidata NRRL YB-4993]
MKLDPYRSVFYAMFTLTSYLSFLYLKAASLSVTRQSLFSGRCLNSSSFQPIVLVKQAKTEFGMLIICKVWPIDTNKSVGRKVGG